MSVTEPGQAIKRFMELFNKGDKEGLLTEMYGDDIVLCPGPGAEPVSGKAGVGAVLDGFLAMKATMTLLGSHQIVNGDLAVSLDHWRLAPPDGDAMEGTTTDLLRRHPDGTWKYMIDNPFGVAVLG